MRHSAKAADSVPLRGKGPDRTQYAFIGFAAVAPQFTASSAVTPQISLRLSQPR